VKRPAPTIWAKLALAYLVPTALFFAPVAILAYRASSTELEAQLGRRLTAIASSAATQIRVGSLLREKPGDESKEWPYGKTRAKLAAIERATGAERIFVFRPDHTSLCDTEETPIGTEYHQLAIDQNELDQLFAGGSAVSSTLYQGKDRTYYKAGYAPLTVSEEDPTIVAAIAVEAPAEYFQRLETLQRHLKNVSLSLAALYIVVSLVVAALIVRPIRRLTASAERIGRGDLEARVPARGRDEIAFLGRTLDEMREGLRARNERLQMMLAGIAHEVRNPLGGIELFSGILREELGGDAEKLGHVQRIEREVGHLKAVVNDFLEYARRTKPELVPLDLRPLCEEIAEVVAADAKITTLAEPTARALADRNQLRRAILNLVRNAIQAGGAVTLRATQSTIVVADTGKGIAPEDKEKIFAPFYTTKEKGTGLGLAFVKEIVDDHGGMLVVESEVGRGTTITVRLRSP
jgi:signal transduction histidine kinase